MKTLFEDDRFPPKTLMIETLLKMRKQLGTSEDDWTSSQVCQVRDDLGPAYANLDPTLISNYMRRLRKDKLVPRMRSDMSHVERLQKMLRDFIRHRIRNPSKQTKMYQEYIMSSDWARISAEHKRRCEYCCQLCGRESSQLEVHHTRQGYRNLTKEKPHHLIAVCKNPCHILADMLRSGFCSAVPPETFSYFPDDDV